MQICLSERHLATFDQQVLFCKSACQRGTWPLPTSRCFKFANLPVRKALGHFQPAGAFCKSACQKGSWPLSTSRCFLQICMSERQLATFYQQVLFANLHVRSAYWQLATFNQQVNFALEQSKMLLGHLQPASEFCIRLATFNQHYHFACKNTLGHFHPSKHFAILSMGRKAKSPVTVCGNSRNVTSGSLERQNRKWPLSATDPGGATGTEWNARSFAFSNPDRNVYLWSGDTNARGPPLAIEPRSYEFAVVPPTRPEVTRACTLLLTIIV